MRMLVYAVDNEGLDEAWLVRVCQKLKVKGNGKPAEERPIKEISDALIIEMLQSAAASKAQAWKRFAHKEDARKRHGTGWPHLHSAATTAAGYRRTG